MCIRDRVKTFNQYIFEPVNVIIAKALVEKQFGQKFFETTDEEAFSKYQSSDKKIPYTVLKTVTGEELFGIRYEQLLPYALPYENPENAFRVIGGNFVTTEDGTGVVHLSLIHI